MNLINGEAIQSMSELPTASIDCVITDPPYGTTEAEWDSIIAFEDMWRELRRVTKPRAAIVLFGAQPFTSRLIMSNVENFRYSWVWDKQWGRGHLAAKVRPLQRTEDIAVFAYGGHNYYPIMEPYDTVQSGQRYAGSNSSLLGAKKTGGGSVERTHKYPQNLLSMKSVPSSAGRIHPTQKPVELMRYLVETYSRPGDTVLDFTMGSGSTGVAAIQLERKFVGIEINPEYYAAAKARLENTRVVPYTVQDGLF